jgi:two-component system LytT family response regulator
MEVMIIDDEASARRMLRECCEKEVDLAVVGEYSNGAAALAAIEQRAPALVFLDIQMDEMSGLQVAHALAASKEVQVVFVTAHDHYAVQAFELNAVDYLVKPFNDARFRLMLDKVRHRMITQHAAARQSQFFKMISELERARGAAPEMRPRLLAEMDGRMQMVDVEDIEVIESDRNYVTLRVGKDALRARSTLQQAEQAMRSQPLLRVSRSCLVNINHLREVTKTRRGDYILVLEGGVIVTSSQGYRDQVRARLETLMLGPRSRESRAEPLPKEHR